MKIKRWIKILLGSVVIILILFLLLISPVAKWYIERHSEEWTGRRIVMDKLGLNLLTGSISIEQLRVFEKDKATVFFSMQEFYLNLELWKAINGQYEIIEVTMKGPSVAIIQEDDSFNFSDLLAHFTKSDTIPTPAESDPIKFWVRNISITSGAARYHNRGLGNEVTVRQLNAACPLISSTDSSLHATLDFKIDKGGEIASVLDMNIKSKEYRLNYDMNALNLDLLCPYLKDYINVGEMKGAVHTHMLLGGNFNEPDAIAATGTLALHELSITDPNKEPLIGIGSFTIAVDTLNIKSDLYNFGSISLVKPFLKLERFDNETNFSRLVRYTTSDTTAVQDSVNLQVTSGNVFELIASYIQDISENYSISNYKADSVILREGTFIFNDYTLQSKFNYHLEHLFKTAATIPGRSGQDRVRTSGRPDMAETIPCERRQGRQQRAISSD